MKDKVEIILEYIKSLENKWGWDYLTTCAWGDPYINSDKIIEEIKELIKTEV
jgi:hypothetical protein